MRRQKVFISIEDNVVRESLYQFLSAENMECTASTNFTSALNICKKGNCFDSLIISLDFYKKDAVQLYDQIINLPCNPLTFFIVPYLDREYLKIFKELKRIECLISPIDFNQLLVKLEANVKT